MAVCWWRSWCTRSCHSKFSICCGGLSTCHIYFPHSACLPPSSAVFLPPKFAQASSPALRPVGEEEGGGGLGGGGGQGACFLGAGTLAARFLGDSEGWSTRGLERVSGSAPAACSRPDPGQDTWSLCLSVPMCGTGISAVGTCGGDAGLAELVHDSTGAQSNSWQKEAFSHASHRYTIHHPKRPPEPGLG